MNADRPTRRRRGRTSGRDLAEHGDGPGISRAELLLRRLPLGILAVSSLALVPVSLQRPDEAGSAGETWTFVSIPDFLNNDVDYPDPLWDDALDYVLDQLKAEDPDFVLVPGDLIDGHWWDGAEDVRTNAERYYTAWQRRMEDKGLTFYAVVGDHEIGDNDWDEDKQQLVPVFKEEFADRLGMPRNGPPGHEGLAWSRRHKNLTLVAVDVFEQDASGTVTQSVSGNQLSWVRDTLAAADTTHTIVTGHVPVLPTDRRRASSGLTLAGGAGAPLWTVISEGGASLYLAGEMHDISAAQKDGVLQIVHGSQPGAVEEFNYLVATVSSESIDLELKRIVTEIEGLDDEVPVEEQAGGLRRPPGPVTVPDAVRAAGPESIGTARVGTSPEDGGVRDESGVFKDRLSRLS